MKRNLSLMAAAIVASTLAVPALVESAVARELKVAHFMPPVHHLQRDVFVPWAAKLAEVSGGELTLAIFPAGQLGPGPVDQYKRAVEGVTDISFICHAFTPNLFPKSLLSIQVGASTSAEDATKRYYNIFDEFLADEYTEVRNLAVWSAAPTIVASRERPVTSVDDLEGAKVSTGGAAFNPVIAAWGAEPISQGLGEINNSVSTGVTDMVIISASILVPPWNLQEVAQHVTVGIPGLFAPCGIIISNEVWNDLSDQEKAWLTETTGRELALDGARSFDNAANTALALARQNPRLKIVTLGDAARQRFLDQARPLVRSTLEELEANGVSGAAAAYQALNQ